MAWSAATALWGSDQESSATAQTGMATGWANATSVINLNPGESCVINLHGTSDSATASDLLYRVLATDGTTTDTWAYLSGSIPHPGANSTAAGRTFVVYGVKSFIIQLGTSVVSATWTAINGTYTKDGISA